MARGLNKVMVIGNLGRAPELRYTPGGKAVAALSIAVNRRVRDEHGERAEEAHWFRVVFWEKAAEALAERATTGTRLYVEGELRTRSYTDKEGVERQVVEIVGRDFIFLGDGRARSAAPAGESDAAPAAPDDDIPF
jgi:single-strand DNA-binding protein